MKTVAVTFPGGARGRTYDYICPDDMDVQSGGYVVIEAGGEFKVCKVTLVTDGVSEKATTQIVQALDVDGYRQRQNARPDGTQKETDHL